MLFSLARIGGTHLCSTWQRASCRKNLVKGICLKGWQHTTFCNMRSFSRKGTIETWCDRDLLRCLDPEEPREMIKEVHTGEYEKNQGKKKLNKCLLQMVYYWPTMKRDIVKL